MDGWITQARKLQADIKRSQETAKEIVQQAEVSKEKTLAVQDAASKVSLLHTEIAYNESLARVVEQLKDISTLLESAQEAAVHKHILHALERLEDAEGAFKRLGPFETTRVVGLLKTKANQLKSAIVENITEVWNSLVTVNAADRKVTLRDEVGEETGAENGTGISTVVEALKRLGLLEKFIARLAQEFDSVIVQPRLAIGPDQIVSALVIQGDDIQIAGQIGDMSVKAALEDIQAIAEYLSTRTPPSVAIPLSDKLLPVLTNRLISNWLLPAVPLSTKGISDFQETLSLVLGLVEYFDELGWNGQSRLTEWVDKSAEIWLARQKEASIAQIQRIIPRKVQEKKTVERVETQVLSKGDAMLAGKEENAEDWGAEWGDEEPEADAPAENGRHEDAVEEEDMSAWGMDDDDPEAPQKENEEPKAEPQDEEDAEDWGADWGEEEDSKPMPAEPVSKPTTEPKADGQTAKPIKSSKDREMTLRETYTVTAIPDSIIELILQVVTDVNTLNTPELVGSAIAPASGGLFAIPTLLLGMYRATAAVHYSKDIAANMLIYNDCTRLSDRLRNFLTEQAESDRSSSLPAHLKPSARLKPKLDADIKAIEGFGKRAYGREMESQRTILRDHLDAAQGFSSCTKMPFAAECDNAIAMTIDRIADVKNAWRTVLSHSVLLQSLGSLVSTALAKFIADIEDMTDIAEDESKKLRSYCESLSSLSHLFMTEDSEGMERDMTSVYTPNWFKFQYLSEILDSSLADIKYMWTDGELKLEMEVGEVVDLIEALFAESDYRRKAIADIKRTAH